MKLFVATLAFSFVFLAAAQLNVTQPSNEYLPPEFPPDEPPQLTEGGYRH